MRIAAESFAFAPPGGTGATLPALSLKLVREYYSSPTAEAAAAVRAAQGGRGIGQDLWEPLLQLSFVEGLWQQLLALWRGLGYENPVEGMPGPSLLAQYISGGQYPDPDVGPPEPPPFCSRGTGGLQEIST